MKRSDGGDYVVDLFQILTAWEGIVTEYNSQSGELLSATVRVPVLGHTHQKRCGEVVPQAQDEV